MKEKKKNILDDYPYLHKYTDTLFISRVDRFSINRYFIGSDGKQMCELLFYPSEYGMNQIITMEQNIVMSDQAKMFQHRLKQLIEFGNADWHKDVFTNDKIKTKSVFVRKPRKLGVKNNGTKN